MQNGLMRWGICADLKIAQCGEDVQDKYLDISKRKIILHENQDISLHGTP